MNKTGLCDKFRRLFGFVLMFFLSVHMLAVQAQNTRISMKLENASVAQVMKEIERQTRYLFVNKGVDTQKRISIDVSQKSIQEVLNQLFSDTEISYRIHDSHIILTRKDAEQPVTVTGRVHDTAGKAISGAAVIVQGTTQGVSSNTDGTFSLQVPPQLRSNWKSIISAMSRLLLPWAIALLSILRSKSRLRRSNRSWSLLLVLSVRKRP